LKGTLTYKTLEIKDKVFEVVRKMQPVTANEVCKALRKTYGLRMAEEEMHEHLERLRSSFPTRLVHAGPDRYYVIDLK